MTHRAPRGFATAGLLMCVSLLVTAGQATAQVAVTTVFHHPSLDPSEPILNLYGDTAYAVVAILTDRIEVSGSTLVSVGDPVPLIAGATWSALSLAGFADTGGVVVNGSLDGPPPEEDRATLLLGSGGPLVLHQEGVTMAPGTSYHLSGVSHVRLNGSGQIAFRGGLVELGVTGIWAGSPGAFDLVALEGEPAVGVPGATYLQFSNVGRNPIAMNGRGQIAFVARLAGPGIDNFNDRAVYSGRPGALVLIAREGNTVPGGGTYGDLHEPSIGSAGRVAFKDHSTVYLDGIPVVEEGDPAPRGGTIVSVSFPAIDDTLVFRAEVSDVGYLDSYMMLVGDELVEIVREGDEAPGTGGEVFTLLYSNAVVNACGQIGFTGRTTGDRRGVWVMARDGSGVLVAWAGTPSPAGPNFTGFWGHIADRASRCNIEDNGYRYFNQQGQVVFRADLSDGTDGLFQSAPPGLSCDRFFTDGFETGNTSGW